jgi:transposase
MQNGRLAAYYPAVLIKLYSYGYLNRIQTSRRLERESQRNLELICVNRSRIFASKQRQDLQLKN